MRLSAVKKILIDTLPKEVLVWFPDVAEPINNFLDQVTRALTNQLTIQDNLKAATLTLDVRETQAYPMRVSYLLNEKPTAVFVAKITARDGSAIPPYSMTWEPQDGALSVTINGLSAKRYTVTLVCLV